MLEQIKKDYQLNIYYFYFYWGFFFFSAGYFAFKNNKYFNTHLFQRDSFKLQPLAS